MSSNYDVKPINEECSGSKSLAGVSAKNSGNSNVSNSLDSTSYQSDSNNQYDTVNSESVKPLYGGKIYNKYNIDYNNKKSVIYGKDEKNALKSYFKNIKLNKDVIININHKMKKNKFIIRNNKSNSITMINY